MKGQHRKACLKPRRNLKRQQTKRQCLQKPRESTPRSKAVPSTLELPRASSFGSSSSRVEDRMLLILPEEWTRDSCLEGRDGERTWVSRLEHCM
nr:uncharacterized protein LOC127490304 isoform X2 [Oryctolagus cuniculus]